MNDRTSPAALARYFPDSLLSEGRGVDWGNITVQFISHQPSQHAVLVPAMAEPLLVWVVSGAASVDEREGDGEWISSSASRGDFFLTHSPTPYEMRWEARSDEPFVVMHVYLDLSLYRHAMTEVFGTADDTVRLSDVSGQQDETISHLLEMIRSELGRSSNPSAMYVDGIAQALAIHVVRSYGRKGEGPYQRHGALPAFRLRQAIRFMESGLTGRFDLSALAGEVGLSPFHFSRVFRQSTGCTPLAYFTRMKIAEAQRLLRETNKGIIEVALDLGYSSPSHFAQVFRRLTGVSPSDYRH
jgi:AraC family transcriptional regulator